MLFSFIFMCYTIWNIFASILFSLFLQWQSLIGLRSFLAKRAKIALPEPETVKRIAVLMKTSVDFLLGSPSENNLQADNTDKQVIPAVRSDEEKLLGVYNSLDQESKTQLMSVAYLIMSKSLETQGINVQQLIEQQLHKIQEKGGEKDEGWGRNASNGYCSWPLLWA